MALKNQLLKKFGDTKEERALVSSAIGGVIFLRFIVPSITLQTSASNNVHKALTVVSKVILHLSNGTEPKDASMQGLKNYIRANIAKVEQFLFSFAQENIGEEEDPIGITEAQVDEKLLYCLYDVHGYLYSSLPELKSNMNEEKKVVFSCKLGPSDSIEDIKKIIPKTIEIIKEIGPPPLFSQK